MTALTGLVDTVHLTQLEQDDLVLAQTLRSTGKITTPGQPFETLTQTEIDALIACGIFKFKMYDPNVHGGIRIFKSRIVNEGYNDSDKALVLT
ncbi:hypothetical protein BDW02DRAFT_603990 [Decorospora gaudefroyi]|uniref:Uncharacterized protein n=1 Tax=Decorospora gaudefroyi TaxID=184978 RepID=A0A6A5K1C0_9PLEO|nr:hypothetical protein BDW02DRAFT_603990 [Decorospora gaudefroyi]